MSETNKTYRNAGFYKFGDGFTIQNNAPIDCRTYVNNITDIYDDANWAGINVKPYPGMIVSAPSGDVKIYVGEVITDIAAVTSSSQQIAWRNKANWLDVNIPKIHPSDKGRLLTIVETTNDDQTKSYSAQWVNAPSGLPEMGQDEAGKLLTVVETSTGSGVYVAQWINAPSGLPTINPETDANKILQVQVDDAGTAGVAWVDETKELPIIGPGSAGKVLTISADGTTAEWKTNNHPSELPAKTNNELKFLQVTADGKSVQWADVEALPSLQDHLNNKSFLGNDALGRTLWKPYQLRTTYNNLMSMVYDGQLVPGGTYILTDYVPQQTSINGIIGIFVHLLDYCFAQSTSDDKYLKYFQLLKRMSTNGEGSVVDIVLRADSTNSFERTAKMMTKSREFISELVYNEYTNVLSESEINTLIGLFYSILPNIKADVEIELDATKIDINEILIYGIGEMGSGIFPEFKGLIKHMKDSYGNEMPFDFKNVLIGDDLRYMFTDNYKPMSDRTLYVHRHNLSNTGKMRDVRYIIDDEFYNIFGKFCSTSCNSIYNIGKIYYHFDFNQVANISAFNSGSSTFINNVEIHNNPFFIKDTLINGLKIFNDDQSIGISIRQNIDEILQEQGINIINVVNASLILNNVTIKNSAHFIHSLGDSVINTFTFPIDPLTGNATITEIRKILRNITIDLPNNFENYKLLMNSEYLSNYDAMPGDWPSIGAYDHILDISRQMSELIKAKSDQLESTSEAYENDLHKPGGHNDFNENLIQKITNERYVSMMAPLSFGEFLGFKYPTTDTSGGESPVFCLLNLLRDTEKIYRLITIPNEGLVFKLQVPQFDDRPSTSVVELGLN